MKEPTKSSQFPTTDCLSPLQREAFFAGDEVGLELEQHVVGCSYCQALLALEEPSDESIERLMQGIRQELSRYRVSQGERAAVATTHGRWFQSRGKVRLGTREVA